MGNDGRVLTAARTKGIESLNRLAQELLRTHPKPFKGVAARSLGAKLSELNRGVVTWWRSRPHAAQALGQALDIDVASFIDADSASRRGLWSFDEFPELEAINLASDEPATIHRVKPLGAAPVFDRLLESWFTLALEKGNEHRRLTGPQEGISWLYVPSGNGLDLLLARIEARQRVPVTRAATLGEACMATPRSGPVVLAPAGQIQSEDLLHLTLVPPQQPVLVVSNQRLPHSETQSLIRTPLPSWEWLAAAPAERARLSLGSGHGGEHGGLWDEKEIREFELTLDVDWREELLGWLETRLGRTDTLFSASGLSAWLDAFDPDEVFFPDPRAVLSLARLCHQSGERRLPKPSQADAGRRLLQGLGALDSRYLDLLRRLTVVAWLDVQRPWGVSRPWQDWMGTESKPRAPVAASRSQVGRPRSAVTKPSLVISSPPIDREAALKLQILIPTASGEYRLRSPAEASLMLRDLLLGWLHEGDADCWASPTVGDEQRQKLVDAALRGLNTREVEKLCLQSLGLEPWTCQSIGASEALFVAAGLKMAEGQLSYTPDLGRLLDVLFARCGTDQGFNTFPLGRSLHSTSQKLDWIHACWGWSLRSPSPSLLPSHARNWFPVWTGANGNFLAGLTLELAEDYRQPSPVQGRLAPLMLIAAEVVDAMRLDRVRGPEKEEMPALLALINLTRAVLGCCEPMAEWWLPLHSRSWAQDALDSVIDAAARPVSPALAASLLEACTRRESTGYATLTYLRGPLWTRVLQDVEPAAVFHLVSTSAYQLAISHAASLPPRMRTYLVNEAPPERLLGDAHWGVLLSSEELPSDKRIVELLNAPSFFNIAVANWLWHLQPDRCVSWATDSSWPAHQLLLEICPDEHVLKVLDLIKDVKRMTPSHSSWQEWASRRIGRNGPSAVRLVGFLRSLSSEQGDSVLT